MRVAGNSSNDSGVALTAWLRCAGRVGAFLIATALGLATFSANGQPKPATPDGGPIPDPVAGQAETESTKSGGMIAAMWEAMRRGAAARGVEVFVVYDGEAFVN